MAAYVTEHRVKVADPPIAQMLFSDTRFAWIWLIIRVYAGYQWFMAGYEKLINPAWTGAKAGTDITGWYAGFLQSFVIPYAAIWSWAITLGEIAVGLGLIFGILTGFAAFFGGMMNANYLLAGTISTTPLLFIFATWL